jgi:polysaccharide deacetylase family protein (PEP-CTERM system associated)
MRPTLLLSVDFEDWHQLVRRRVAAPAWERPGPALARQTDALLELLDELGARATFFVLGMAARAHPALVERVAARGHEIGCHGDAHLPVYSQTPDEFGADLAAARRTIEELTGQAPLGYRAPAFSITRRTPWAYEVLADKGFAYDASEHDTPRVRDRAAAGNGSGPHLTHRHLWEFPVAVWRLGSARVPVGGASYWSVMPTALVLHALRRAGPAPGLYLHPNELDPQRLDPALPETATASQRARAQLRAVQRNAARRRAPDVLRAIARRFELITYGEAYAKLRDGAAAGT